MLVALFFGVLFFSLTGCATPQTSNLTAHWPEHLPARVELSKIHFYPQEQFECGPASLAMLLQSAGKDVSPEQLVEQVYLPNREGTLQIEMLAATRRYGLLGYQLAQDMTTLLRELAAGHPVLVFQNLSFPIYPIWHYAVAIGYDRERNTLTLHSGRSERQTISLFAFERTWARADYWAMVALPLDQLPATAAADPFAASIAALERVNPRAALTAYQTALKQWPQHRILLFGEGNAAYAQGLWLDAFVAYTNAVRVHPDFADAWNNLAQVSLDLGRRESALMAIDRAVTLGGIRLAQYQSLQREINNR